MAFDRFLIAPFNTGLQTDLRPFLVMDDAFTYLQNAYVFRGRVRKRFGSLLMGTVLQSRLSNSLLSGGAGIGITDAFGGASGNVATILSDASLPFSVGQIFSIGSQIYTVVNPAGGFQGMLTTSGTGSFNISTGAYVFTGAPPLTTIFFYTSFPVMGLTQYESGVINDHPSYAFDTRYAYKFIPGTGWFRSGAAIWKGTNLNYFWAVNWRGISAGGTVASNTGNPVMFVTNFNATTGAGVPAATDDPIWYTPDGTNWTAMLGSSANGIFFNPQGGAPHTGPFVQTARIIVPFKDRLLLLNTIENDNSGGGGTGTATQYKNRCRYSFNGSPFAVNAWYQGVQQDSTPTPAAGGGFLDAATEEAIISVEFVKDRLIVYFERSTWEIAYTGIENDPFQWNLLNTELGSQSTFSTVPFDRECITIGNTGIHACNGSNVHRIDNKIPTEVFDAFETENQAPSRTQGIRDYFNEMVYWNFVDTAATNNNQTFPNQILVYNYQNGSWALNDDCLTVFGYFEQQKDMTWASSADANINWQNATFTWWDNVTSANQRQVIAGTPNGFVIRIESDSARNAPSMQITNMTIPSIVIPSPGYVDLQVINHNVSAGEGSDTDGDFIAIENTNGISLPIKAFYQVFKVTDANNFTIYAPDISGTYLGGGTMARVSNIQMQTKQINPYGKNEQNVYLARADFYVEKTNSGQITVDYYPSASEFSMLAAGQASGAIMGTGVLETSPYDPTLYPFEQRQERLVHPIYFQSTGTCIQLAFYQTPAQLSNGNIAWSDFNMDGICFYACRAGRMQ